MEPWKLWAGALTYWTLLVFVPVSRRVSWWLIRWAYLIVFLMLARTAQGLRHGVVTTWQTWMRHRRRRLWPLRPEVQHATRGQLRAALQNLADLAGWEASPASWGVDKWQRRYRFLSDTMPDRERVSRILCAAGCDAPLARLSIVRDQYGDSNAVLITITDKARPKQAPTPLRIVAPMSPQVDAVTATSDDPYVAALVDGPATTQQLAERFSKARPTVHKAMQKRAADGLVVKVGALWQLPSAS